MFYYDLKSIINFTALYRETMVVRNYILLTIFLKFLNLAQLFRHFGPILIGPIKIGQTVEQPKHS